MPVETADRLYMVQLDLYVGRRTKMHEVQSPSGVVVHHSPSILTVLNFLSEKGVTRAVFTDDEDTYEVSFSRSLASNPNPGD